MVVVGSTVVELDVDSGAVVDDEVIIVVEPALSVPEVVEDSVPSP